MSDRRGVANASAMTNPRSAFPAHARGVGGFVLPAGSVASSGGGGASDVSVDPAPGRPPVPRRRRRVSFIEKSKQRLAVVQKYVTRARGVDKWAIAAWMLVDLCWCQEQQEGMLAAAALFGLVFYKFLIGHGRRSPHEVTHCVALLLWAAGNVSWMWMELGQARLGQWSDYRGAGAAQADWWKFRLASTVFFFSALVVEVTYFAHLRHTPSFEGSWTSNPLTANVIAKHQQRLSASSGSSLESGRGKPPRAPDDTSDTASMASGGSRMSAGAASFASLPTVAGGAALTYGSVESAGGGGDNDDDEMTGILPRFPEYFRTWDDYESLAIMIWIGKDASWMFSTKFTNDLEDWPARLAKWSWLVFTICLLLLHVDFFVASFSNTKDRVEWVNYFCLLLWACSQTLWAGRELFLHESVVRREKRVGETGRFLQPAMVRRLVRARRGDHLVHLLDRQDSAERLGLLRKHRGGGTRRRGSSSRGGGKDAAGKRRAKVT